ncbi:MAG: metallophosphoesterase [Chloroflexi bacterium]|nr:metallophosphoesterase [Chloroflexota bacterium]
MPTLIHLSDLHFGPHHHTHLDELLLRDIATLSPDAVIISGDLTMRARHHEFEQARVFLARIAQPILTIPGNHDQPILTPRDWIERLTRQYARYQKYIHAEIDSALDANGLFVLGLNDNHPLLPGGFWSRSQRAWIEEQLARAARGAVKIIATHHQLVWNGWRPAGFWNSERALEFLAPRGVELVLNGHTHVANALQTSHGIVVARAGTATSGRTRHGNGNAYNLISIDEKQIAVFIRRYDAPANAFVAARAYTFPRQASRR